MGKLQCWDEDGNLTFGATSKILKILGSFQIGESYTGTDTTGTISDGRLGIYVGCEPFYQIINYNQVSKYSPTIAFTDSTLVWSYPISTVLPDVTVIYGLL